MSRDVRRKLASGEELDEADIQYARERGIPLPGDSGKAASNVPPEPVAPQPEPEPEPEKPTETGQPLPDDLSSLTKPALASIGEQRGLDLDPRRMNKDAMIKALEGTVS